MMEVGDLITAQLREPREQLWGKLLRLDASGLVMRCIDTANFEEWCAQLANKGEQELGPTTVFLPAHRIERVIVDERVGVVPSLSERFQQVTGTAATSAF